MHDTFIFTVTMCAIGILTILAMWAGLWFYFDRVIHDDEE